jgi:hypothetical protein
MPNIPKTGAAGQINVAFSFPASDGSEAGEPLADPTTGGRPIMPPAPRGAAGAVDQGNPWPGNDSDSTMAGPHGPEDRPTINPQAPARGAAGGYEVGFETRRPPSQPEPQPQTSASGPVPLT